MKRRFLAAKVNINENIFGSNLDSLIELIADAIKAKKPLKSSRSKWEWKFTDINEYTDNDHWIITANFTKSRKEKKTVVEGDATIEYEIPKPVAYTSFFLYDVKNEILIFEETGEIQRENFIDAFERNIYHSNINIGKIEVKLIPKKGIVYKEIMSMEYLTKVEFDLVHPNLISKESYEDLNDIIKKERATRLKTTLENDEGLNKDGTIINNGIEMVSSGYGDVKAYGFERVKSRGKNRTKKQQLKFKSKDSIEMINTEKNQETNHLLDTLDSFRKRIYKLLHL